MNKYINFLKLLLLLIINNILVGMLLGYIWYKQGFAKLEINMSSGVDTIKNIFVSHRIMYILILFIIEFLTIIIFKKLFKTKKDYVIYYIVSIIISLLLLLKCKFGFDTGSPTITLGKIDDIYIFISCLGLRYTSWLLILNIPTLIGLIYINKKKANVK